jgi:hypothetical protein
VPKVLQPKNIQSLQDAMNESWDGDWHFGIVNGF